MVGIVSRCYSPYGHWLLGESNPHSVDYPRTQTPLGVHSHVNLLGPLISNLAIGVDMAGIVPFLAVPRFVPQRTLRLSVALSLTPSKARDQSIVLLLAHGLTVRGSSLQAATFTMLSHFDLTALSP